MPFRLEEQENSLLIVDMGSRRHLSVSKTDVVDSLPTILFHLQSTRKATDPHPIDIVWSLFNGRGKLAYKLVSRIVADEYARNDMPDWDTILAGLECKPIFEKVLFQRAKKIVKGWGQERKPTFVPLPGPILPTENDLMDLANIMQEVKK